MGMVLTILGGLLCLVSTIAYIIVLIHAFKTSAGQGLLCLCISPYAIYYMFAKFQSPKKGLVLAMFFGGYILGGALVGVGMGQMAAAQLSANPDTQKAMQMFKEMNKKAK
jgi:hypothetical protein